MKRLVNFFKSLGNDKKSRSSEPLQLHPHRHERTVEVGRLIGFGNFSFVCIGLLKTNSSTGKPIAVKIPREDITAQMDFSQELSIMKRLGSHEYILGVIDIIQSSQIKNCSFHGTFLLTNLCQNGSLKDYVRRLGMCYNKNEDAAADDDDDDGVPPVLLGSVARLFESAKFAYQIASGMEFISSRDIIHGDLSARNVLLDERKNCKISDFGLSRRTDLTDDHGSTNKRIIGIPWRWLAPECFDGSGGAAASASSSTQSDVWSFGVTLWEIFSLGECPYFNMRWGPEFKKGIQRGTIRLPMPERAGLDEGMATLMQSCWVSDPLSRPTFSSLAQILHSNHKLSLGRLSDPERNEVEAAQPTKILSTEMVQQINGDSSAESGILTGGVSYGREIPLREFCFYTEWMDAGYDRHDFAYATVYGRDTVVKATRGEENNFLLLRMAAELRIHREIIGPHPFIVPLVGAFTGEVHRGILYIATLLCENGSLLEYFEEYRDELLGDTERLKRLIGRFASEIAAGLEYLNSKNIAHLGKGIQSVLLDAMESCKLRDFSFSQCYEPPKMMDAELVAHMAVRWAPPEVLQGKPLNNRTNVWSFGVTLWEMYSLAHNVPNFGTREARRAFDVGENPPLLLASQEIVNKILECCNADARLRPDFAGLKTYFRNESVKDYYMEL